MKPKLGVIACGDSGDIFSVLTSGRYDHRLLKKHIWEDNQNGGQTIFTYPVVWIIPAIH